MTPLVSRKSLEREVANTPDLLENRPAREQALVMGAGIAANIVLAWACLFTSGVALGIPLAAPSAVVVSRVVPSSAAEAAGFRAGDRILRVGRQPVEGTSSPLQSSK